MSSKNQIAKRESLFSRCSLAQISAVSVKNFVLVGYGMTLGYPTLLIPMLSNRDNGEPFFLESEGISWIGSISMICIPVGALVSGIVTQPIGRKRSMQLINIPQIVAWMFFYFSSKIWHIFAGLVISGLIGGLMEAPVLTYVAEVCQPHMRGMLASASTMSVIAGIMIQFVLGTFLEWRSVALCCTAFPIISFNLLFLIPETPIWLMSKRRYEDAKRSFAWLRGWVTVEDITEEYDNLFKFMHSEDLDNNKERSDKSTSESNQLKKLTILETLKLVKKRECMRPYILVAYICFLAHFSGMSAVQTYAVKVFNVLRTPIDGHYATASLGIVEMLGCIMCVATVRNVGKRFLTFTSLIGTAICFVVLGIYAHSLHINSLISSENTEAIITNSTAQSMIPFDKSAEVSWIPLTFIIFAAFLSHMGIRALPAILIGEVFPNETRGIATGMSGASFFVLSFLCNKIFLSMVSILTLAGTFWLFSSISSSGFIVLYFMLPETEGKSLQEITDHFSGKSKLKNNVFKHDKQDSCKNEASEKLFYE